MAISAVAGMRMSTVSACTTSSAAPLRAPATPYSGWKSLFTLHSDSAGTGERQRTASSGRPNARALSQWTRLSWPVSIITPARSGALTMTRYVPTL